MVKTFRRELGSLENIFDMISRFASEVGVPASAASDVCLAVEELFVNMVKYNPGSTKPIQITISTGAKRVIVSLTDYDVEPFDVTKVPEYDSTLPLEKRRPGGIGIHLARRVMDEVSYDYDNGRSTVTMAKILRESNV